jgi:hypothetical protein
MSKSSDRLDKWLNAGMPDDDKSLEKFNISYKDIKKLNERILDAIVDKMSLDPSKITFSAHSTLQ